MSIFYGTGTHRLIYKAQNFNTGLTVTGYVWNPSLTKSALQTFTEVSDGLYYLDYNFVVIGVHFGKFYEGGIGTTEGTFRVVTLNDITVAEIIAGIADGSYDFQEMIRILFAACAGKSTGGGTSINKFRNSADEKNRIVATVDANGNRTTITLDGS